MDRKALVGASWGMFPGRIFRLSRTAEAFDEGWKLSRARARARRFMMRPTRQPIDFHGESEEPRVVFRSGERIVVALCSRHGSLRASDKIDGCGKNAPWDTPRRDTALDLYATKNSLREILGTLDVKPRDLSPPVVRRLRFQFLTVSNVATYVALQR